MTSSTAGSSKSLTPTELVETRNATLGLRLSVYATILGIFALLTTLVTILVSSFSSIGPTGLAAVRWSMLVSIWIYLATAVRANLNQLFEATGIPIRLCPHVDGRIAAR